MKQVNTDKKAIEELLTRGVEKIYPNKAALEKELLAGKRLRLYCGFDPSAKSLHIGNAILINKLAQFQKMGHEVIFLIGDFTGMIGDPTDKTSVRKKLTREEVSENSVEYKNQAQAFLDFKGDNAATVRYNSEWQDKLTFKDLIELSSNFTVGQMIIREMFQRRLKEEKPIYLHEFLYPLAQAYDSVAMEVDLEIGGNDQMFNMMCGRDLIKNLKNKEKFVLTTKLLADANGNKMGKTTGNALFLDQSANDMFGTVMSWPDEIIPIAFELCTQVELANIKKIKERLSDGENPKNLKIELALEIVTIFRGAELAKKAAEYFQTTISEKSAPTDIVEIALAQADSLFLAVVSFYGAKKSKNDLRRLFEQKAVYINGEQTDNLNFNLKIGDVVRVGKRDWFKII
ncbi:MAG: tyrosine--tRNA ligase [Patescibacteria group bacterium]|nr:tyrosine--tRNA ligase [Patescibacteria group bacterium]